MAPAVFEPLREDLLKSYLDLFRLAPTLEYSQPRIDKMRQYLKEGEDYCVGRYKSKSGQYDSELQQLQSHLKRETAKLGEQQRHNLHCRIQNDRALKSQTEVIANHAIPWHTRTSRRNST